MVASLAHSPMLLDQERGTHVQVTAVASGVAALGLSHAPDPDSSNEDVAAATRVGRSGAVLVVADGCGGRALGHLASRTAVECILNAVESATDADLAAPGGLREHVLRGIDLANLSVRELGSGAACTLAVAEVNGHTIRPYHVGDTQVLVVGQRGRIRLSTIPHSPVGYGVEAGLLSEDDALQHEDRHIVSNLVGAEEMRIEVGPVVSLKPLDTVLVASDGLFDNLSMAEIVAITRKGPPDSVVAELLEQAGARMSHPEPGMPSKPDDIGLALFRRSSRRRQPPSHSKVSR